jgi:DNA-binding response OmpR family regulator
MRVVAESGYPGRIANTHMTRPREKPGPLGEKIVTVWSAGYRFVV